MLFALFPIISSSQTGCLSVNSCTHFIVGLFIDFQFLCVIYLIRFSIQVSLQHNQIANVSNISLITLRKNMLYGRIILKNLLLLIITIELLKCILIILAAVAFLVKQRLINCSVNCSSVGINGVKQA